MISPYRRVKTAKLSLFRISELIMFSRIGRSAYRSSLNKGAITGGYGVRPASLAEISSANDNGFAACENSGFGFLKNYLTSARAGAGKQIAKLHHLKELDSTFANPSLRRLFCNQAPKMEESEADEQSNSTEPTNKYEDIFRYVLIFCAMYLSTLAITYEEPKEISFQELKNKLLERPGLIDHIVVSSKKSYAKVYVRSSSPNDNQINAGDSNSRRLPCSYRFYFDIGSVESFEEELKEAQESLGVDHHHYVPVISDSYSEMDPLKSILLMYGPTLILLLALINRVK